MDVILSDRMRRLICRAGFIGCCLLPTLFVLRWILFPLSAGDWSETVQRQLGIPVAIERVQSLTPQQMVFHKLQAGRDDWTSRVTVDRATISNLPSGRLVQLNDVSGSPEAVWQCLSRIASDAICFDQSHRSILVEINQLELVSDDSPAAERLCLEQLQIRIDPFGRQLMAQVKKGPDGSLLAQDQRIAIQRQPGAGDAPIWQIKNLHHPLPVWVLRPCVHQLAFLNRDCLLHGELDMARQADQWRGSFRGTLDNVDLKHVVYEKFAQPISGRASVLIELGRFADSRINLLQGRLTSGQGQIGPRLLQACSQWLSAAVVSGHGRVTEVYRDLNVQFEIKNHQLSIAADRSDGLIARDADGQAMIYVANGRRHAISNLISMLVFPLDRGLPLTRETESLARHLALPPAPSLISLPDVHRAERGVGDESYFK